MTWQNHIKKKNKWLDTLTEFLQENMQIGNGGLKDTRFISHQGKAGKSSNEKSLQTYQKSFNL